MDAANLVVNTIIPIFLIIAIGYVIGKKKEADVQPIVDLIVYISGPALIFTSVKKSDVVLGNMATIFSAAALIIITQGIIVYFILKRGRPRKTGLYLPMVIGNTGYLGYPVALFAFGNAGLSNAIIYDMTNSLFIFSLGIYIVHHRNEFREIFKVPLIYAVLGGIAFKFFSIDVPWIIFEPLEMVGSITIPAALLVLGYKLTQIKISNFKISFFAACFKIFGGLLIGLAAVNLLNISGLARSIILIESAMPSAVMSMILTHKYGRNPEIVASVVFLTTLMSIPTIPLILFFLA
ncbi:hypothetical protein GF323_02185 [Candidatus Woesearchaeota archaeon]|nr:hypothetical protein [Candidatus Woesearchaeota archaeon]